MISLTHDEVLLYKVLAGLFGKESVIPNMRVVAICGGSVPGKFFELPEMSGKSVEAFHAWAEKNSCLFTVIDSNDDPKMVVELFSGFDHPFPIESVEHQQFLRPLFTSLGIRYITFSEEELTLLLDPNKNTDLVALLFAKVESS